MENISKALVALQSEMGTVDKSATNPFFKSAYAPLPEVMKTAQPLLAKHKLAVLLPLTNLNGESAIKTIIIHESGEMMEFDPLPLMLSKQDAQGQGSAITYARRYAIMSVLGMVADDDDDGNAASKPTEKPMWKKAKESEENFVDTVNIDDGTPEPATTEQINEFKALATMKGYGPGKISATIQIMKTKELADKYIKQVRG